MPTIRNQRPTWQNKQRLPLAELPVPANIERGLVNEANCYIRLYTLGQCRILVTRELGKWHLSISCRDRYPDWDEIAEARYRVLPNAVTMAMVLPPKEEYVNMHPNTFHLWEIEGN